MKSVEIDSQGNVTIEFNKKIIVSRIEIASDSDEKDEAAKTGLIIPRVKIEDFLSLEVLYEDYYDSLDKRILNYTAVSVDDQKLIFNVKFS